MSPEQNTTQLFSYESSESAEIQDLVWASITNHRHFEEKRGAHDPAVWQAYSEDHLTAAQLEQLQLIPGRDYIPLEEATPRELGHLGLAAAM